MNNYPDSIPCNETANVKLQFGLVKGNKTH